MRMRLMGVVALALLTAACGTTTQQRAASGGLTGLGVGALVGGPVGAIVGGAVGAAGGWAMPEGAETLALNAIHKEKTVASGALNDAGLGPSSGSSRLSQGQLVRDAQSELQRQGLYRGAIDGIVGPETKQAIAAYQAREGLQQTASLDQETLQRMNLASRSTRAAQGNHGIAASGPPTPMMSADEVRDRLQSAGYTNISNLRAQGQRYTAHAQRSNNDTYTLRIDGHTGKVISEQRVAANQGQAAGSGATGAASGASSNAASGSTSPTPGSTSTSPGSSTSTSTETGTGTSGH